MNYSAKTNPSWKCKVAKSKLRSLLYLELPNTKLVWDQDSFTGIVQTIILFRDTWCIQARVDHSQDKYIFNKDFIRYKYQSVCKCKHVWIFRKFFQCKWVDLSKSRCRCNHGDNEVPISPPPLELDPLFYRSGALLYALQF